MEVREATFVRLLEESQPDGSFDGAIMCGRDVNQDILRGVVAFEGRDSADYTGLAMTVTLSILYSGRNSDPGVIRVQRILRTAVGGALGYGNVGLNWNHYTVADDWTVPGCGGADTDYDPTDAADSNYPAIDNVWQEWDVTQQFLASGTQYAALVKSYAEPTATPPDFNRADYETGAYLLPRLSISGLLIAPTNVAVADRGKGRVRVSWTKNGAASGYQIFRGGTNTPTQLVATVGDVALYDDAVMPGLWYYRVKAISDDWDASPYSSAVDVTTTAPPPFRLDLGNGLVAGVRSSESIQIMEHSGLEAPGIELPIVQNSILDGGTLGDSRSEARRITLLLQFLSGAAPTRYELAALFTPGVQRYLTSPRGWMPYYVEMIGFPDANPATRPLRLSLSLLSPYGCPLGGPLLETAALGSLSFPSRSDVRCPCVITATMPANGTAVRITTPEGITTLTRAVHTNDVIIIDSETFIVTDGGVNALADFDTTGVWPWLVPGSNDVTAEVLTASGYAYAPFTVAWKPRLMGFMT